MTPLSRRGFLATLAAVPAVAVAALKSAPVVVYPIAYCRNDSFNGLEGLINNGTSAPTYSGIC
jgi:hypothetical protein